MVTTPKIQRLQSMVAMETSIRQPYTYSTGFTLNIIIYSSNNNIICYVVIKCVII
jgi:hypothetical protein